MNRPVVRVQDRSGEPLRHARIELVAVEPLGGEAVGAKSVEFALELRQLVAVCGEAQAAGPVERVAGELGEPVESTLGPFPELTSRRGAKPLASAVVRHRSTAEREASVTTARAAGELTRLVEDDPEPSFGERERAGAARDASTDDGDIGGSRQPDVGQLQPLRIEPVRAHAAMLLSGTVRPFSLDHEPRELELRQQ